MYGAPALTGAEAKSIADGFGYPVVFKLLDHSGGMGMKVVTSSRQIDHRVAGNLPVLVEKYVARLRRLARKIVAGLDLQPTADVDIIWGPDGPQVLEINPRFGGVTALSMAASGVPVYRALIDMVLGVWNPGRYPFDRAFAADLPISSHISPATVAELLNTEGVFRVKLQKLKKTAGRVALKAGNSRQLLRPARQAARLCGYDYNCYLELKELLLNN